MAEDVVIDIKIDEREAVKGLKKIEISFKNLAKGTANTQEELAGADKALADISESSRNTTRELERLNDSMSHLSEICLLYTSDAADE